MSAEAGRAALQCGGPEVQSVLLALEEEYRKKADALLEDGDTSPEDRVFTSAAFYEVAADFRRRYNDLICAEWQERMRRFDEADAQAREVRDRAAGS